MSSTSADIQTTGDNGDASPLSPEQEAQENEYRLPVHYRDVIDGSGLNPVLIEYQVRLRLVKRLILESKPGRVLDAGCGDGRFCYETRGLGPELVGADYSAAALRFARAFCPDVTFYQQDLTRLDLPGRFDAILCMETLEHLKPELLERTVGCFAEATEPGARLVVTVPSTELPVAAKHYQHFDATTLRGVIEPRFRVDRMLGVDPCRGTGLLWVRAWTAVAYLAFPLRDRMSVARSILRGAQRQADACLVRATPTGCNHLVAVCTRQ